MKKIALLAGVLILPAGLFGKSSPTATTRSEVIPSKDDLHLAFPGQKGPIDYEKFGEFQAAGTPNYKYVVKDHDGLAKASGEGIYPNTDVYKDPAYQKLSRAGKLKGNQWTFVDTRMAALNFYKWTTTAEDPGVKQFYIAMMFERLGDLADAVKGFYAVAVYFPKAVGYTYFHTPWYMGTASLDRLEQILRRHPDLNMTWSGNGIQIENKFDTKTNNDVFSVDPGRLEVGHPKEASIEAPMGDVVKTVGGPRIQLKKYSNHHWQLFVDNKPFAIRAISYSLTPVGMSPDRGTWDVSKDWQLVDTNKNKIHDGFFESFVDKNGNGVRDADEPVVGDAQLLKDMGVNTIRAYHHIYDKELFRKLYKDYGFYVLCGDLLGGYAVGSGATWADGTNYSDRAQQKKMLDGVRKMVEEYKDEPYILMWVLGNENVYGVGNNSGKDPSAFYEVVDKAAQLIHKLDPSRPVAIANGDMLHMDDLKVKAPHVDVFGANVYRGEQGFGRSFFQDVRDLLDKPVLITEYGAPAYADGFTQKEAEEYQAMYLANNWEDIEAHMAGHGVGNALGGALFEFIDEWWKANTDMPANIQHEHAEWYAARESQYKSLQPGAQDKVPQFGGPFLDGWSYEEWFGITSQGSGKGSPFARTLRPAYYRMKELWNTK